MRRCLVSGLLLSTAFWLAGCASGVAGVTTTEPVGPVQVVQAAVERELGVAVMLDVHDQRTDGEWFFLTATPLTPDGNRIDYATTRLADRAMGGEFDDWLCALLRASDQRAWDLVELEIGATDVPFVDWPDRHGVSRELILNNGAT
jgi:hypothetical protein